MSVRLISGDAIDELSKLEAGSVRCCVTSPPYWGLRSYLPEDHPRKKDEVGQEPTPSLYVEKMVRVFREVRRVLADDGTLWLNLGDSYATAWSSSGGGGVNEDISRPVLVSGTAPKTQANRIRAAFASEGLKEKDLVGIPWRVAFALQADGWWLRMDNIWWKPNSQPESVKDRPSRAHEYLFLLSKAPTYFYDVDAVREPHADPRKSGRAALRGQASLRPRGNLEKTERWYNPAGRNKRSVWAIPSEPYGDAHFAVMPKKLVVPCIASGSAVGDTVIDPFGGSGTVGEVATELGRNAILIDLHPDYTRLQIARTSQQGLFGRAESR